MKVAKNPDNESQRLAELMQYEILDTKAEDSFNEIVELASWICKAPISIISLIDSSRQWFKAKTGIPKTESETERQTSFCAHTIVEDDYLVINDALKDERFFDNPFVKRAGIRFYAGVPLISDKGFKIGSLCVLDTVPRDLSDDQIKALRTLSKQAMNLIKLRVFNKNLETEAGIAKEDNKVLTKLNDIKDKLFTVVCHDIRSPLATIQSTLDLFSEGLFTKEEFTDIANEMSIQMKNTTAFIDNLLLWAKSQFDGIKPNPIKFNFRNIVDDTVKLLLPSAKEKNIKLKSNIDFDINVKADPDMVKIILRNLVSNALKFSVAGDSITIGAEKNPKKNEAIFYVKDTGRGMTEEVKDKLFRSDMFYTSVGTNKEKGTGIGLILCRDLLEKNNGRIWVESEPGKGSVFIFTLPVCA